MTSDPFEGAGFSSSQQGITTDFSICTIILMHLIGEKLSIIEFTLKPRGLLSRSSGFPGKDGDLNLKIYRISTKYVRGE